MTIDPKCDVCKGYYVPALLIQIGKKYICDTCVKDIEEALGELPPRLTPLTPAVSYKKSTTPVPIYFGSRPIEDDKPPAPITA